MKTLLNIYKRSLFWSLVILFAYFNFSDVILAQDITPNFLSQEKDAEASIGKILKEVFNWLLYAAMGLGAIGAAMGLAETSGVFGQKEKGIEKIKIGLAVVAVAGVFLGVVSFFAGLGT